MVFGYLSALVTAYVESALQGALGSVDGVLRQFLFGAALFVSGIAFMLFGAFMLLIGFFLYWGQLPQFLIPAVCAAGLSAFVGLSMLISGSAMSRLTHSKK